MNPFPEFKDLVEGSDVGLTTGILGLTPEQKEVYEKLVKVLNKPCHMSWVKNHPSIKVKRGGQMVPLQYLPIDKVRFLLDRIFGLYWKPEVVSYTVMFNACAVHVRLHYRIPDTNIWLFKDGLGAAPVQTDKGESAANLSAIKADAVMKALPSALSYALSNAAGQWRLFGSDLNKDDVAEWAGTWDPTDEPKAPTKSIPSDLAQTPQTPTFSHPSTIFEL